jgi:hypothetical protein
MGRRIPEEAWRHFLTEVNGASRYDGLRFENLVRDLLDRFFSGNWSSTSRSWDGGRDFVDRSIEGEEQWAECKMYRGALSLRVLSPTLVMAIMGKTGPSFSSPLAKSMPRRGGIWRV